MDGFNIIEKFNARKMILNGFYLHGNCEKKMLKKIENLFTEKYCEIIYLKKSSIYADIKDIVKFYIF